MKVIAILACNRFDILLKTFKALLKCTGFTDYHLILFLDVPASQDHFDNFNKIENFFLHNTSTKLFKTFTLYKADSNLGVWKAKIATLNKAFEMGADFTLLLEDDVILMPDALWFLSSASQYVLAEDRLFTISLYSNNLLNLEGVSQSGALQFILDNPSVFHKWGLRTWPFPWGIGLSKRMYEALLSARWNGNDQQMGKILSDLGGSDLFPIVSRSDHIGESMSKNGKFGVVKHIEFEEWRYLDTNFDFQAAGVNAAIENANFYFMKLKNDLLLSDNRLKILYGDLFFVHQINNFKISHPYLVIDSFHVNQEWFSDGNLSKIHDIIDRVSTPLTILLFNGRAELCYLLSEFESKPTKILTELDGDKVLAALRGIH